MPLDALYVQANGLGATARLLSCLFRSCSVAPVHLHSMKSEWVGGHFVWVAACVTS